MWNKYKYISDLCAGDRVKDSDGLIELLSIETYEESDGHVYLLKWSNGKQMKCHRFNMFEIYKE